MRLYNTPQWRALRQRKLRANPYCQCPHHKGQQHKAEVVDHIKPHKGDRRLFFDYSNLMSMSKSCHDKFKQSQEKGGRGFDQGCDVNGEPLNQDSHWYGN